MQCYQNDDKHETRYLRDNQILLFYKMNKAIKWHIMIFCYTKTVLGQPSSEKLRPLQKMETRAEIHIQTRDKARETLDHSALNVMSP